MIKTVVSGAAGRMGTRIVALMREMDALGLHGAMESASHPALGSDAGQIAGIGNAGVSITADIAAALSGAQALIDFSHAESSLPIIRVAAEKGVPTVIGTTGISRDGVEEISRLAEKIPIVFAPNMSIGVNLLFKVLADVAKVLGDDYDIEIVEAHHRMKKDAPSGTAMKMAQVIADAVGRNLDEVGVYERKGMIGERTRKEIGIQTVRAGDIVGEHTVMFCTPGERVEITHKASSRDTFAKGALRAAVWIAGKNPGLYTMQDVLGLR